MSGAWVNILNGFREILSAPLRDLSILWLLAPVVLFWFILEVYFGRYKKESLGWNTALGNGLNLFWIVVISFRALFMDTDLFSIDKLIFVIFITLYSAFIILISFTHKVREKIFFLFASPTIVYYLSGIAILWIHDLINIQLWVIIDLIVLYMVILILETILKKLIPPATRESGLESSMGTEFNTGAGNIEGNLGKI